MTFLLIMREKVSFHWTMAYAICKHRQICLPQHLQEELTGGRLIRTLSCHPATSPSSFCMCIVISHTHLKVVILVGNGPMLLLSENRFCKHLRLSPDCSGAEIPVLLGQCSVGLSLSAYLCCNSTKWEPGCAIQAKHGEHSVFVCIGATCGSSLTRPQRISLRRWNHYAAKIEHNQYFPDHLSSQGVLYHYHLVQPSPT